MEEKLQKLREYFLGKDKVAVAFSGGVDSSFLLAVAHEVLKEKVIAITIISPAHPKKDVNDSISFAKRLGVKHEIILDAMEDEEYRSNPSNRCYHCKKIEFGRITQYASDNNIELVVDGTNADDKKEYRPGLKAANEKKVSSPLAEIGLTKDEIRKLSKEMGLATWDRPSSPCLSSRFPYGTAITDEKLRQVEDSEEFIASLGIKNLRVRYHGDIARIEVEPKDFENLIMNKERINRHLKSLGFKHVCLDLAGFKSGSLNEGLLWIKTK